MVIHMSILNQFERQIAARSIFLLFGCRMRMGDGVGSRQSAVLLGSCRKAVQAELRGATASPMLFSRLLLLRLGFKLSLSRGFWDFRFMPVSPLTR